MAAERGWEIRRRHPAAAIDALGLDSPVLAQILLNRGCVTRADAEAFLNPGIPLADPRLLADAEAGVARVRRAIKSGEQIVVYGDYDVDGLTGASLLWRALRALDAQCDVFIPHRERHGYGLNTTVLSELRSAGVGLVLTADCGVTALAEIDAASRSGLGVVVTDHHTPAESLPAASAVVNPRRADCQYPFKDLSGSGVAFRFAELLLKEVGPEGLADQVLDELVALAALGTVADVMPLIGENRQIVHNGLASLNRAPSVGLQSLLESAGLGGKAVRARDIAFRLAPRLNAAGRLADARLAYSLLMASDPARGEALAAEVGELNDRRRELTEEALAHALSVITEDNLQLHPAILVWGDYPAGVVGLVAARLSDRFNRLVAVASAVASHDELVRGSVRSVEGVNAVDALTPCGELLAGFGGHAAAAGFTIERANLPAFRERLCASVESLTMAAPAVAPGLVAECKLRSRTITPALCQELDRLEPFGEGNERPRFVSHGLTVTESRLLNGGHIALRARDDGGALRAVRFNPSGWAPSVGDRVDLLYHVRRNDWQGQVSAELDVVDWRPAATA
ncbi:MAG: single-stranded-DNA-specific exonuclease RecJ [Chloroflexota bacterium]